MPTGLSRNAAAAIVVAAATSLTAIATPALAAATFDVHAYGAVGNGSAIDSPAVNHAITAAGVAGGGTVRFTARTYKSAN